MTYAEEGSTVAAVTLAEAGRRLDADPRYVKGAAEAIGIKLGAAGSCLVMTEADFAELSCHLSSLARAFRGTRAG